MVPTVVVLPPKLSPPPTEVASSMGDWRSGYIEDVKVIANWLAGKMVGHDQGRPVVLTGCYQLRCGVDVDGVVLQGLWDWIRLCRK